MVAGKKTVPRSNIVYFIKFFAEEIYADQFLAGSLYLNTLGYFKDVEVESSDGRMDSTEAVAMWWQPNDLIIKLSVPGIGDVEITEKDLAAPVSTSFRHHDYLHLFCLYAVHASGFVDGKIECAPEDVEQLQERLKIDDRCFEFGKFAVITLAVPFLDHLRGRLKSLGYRARGQLVKYYDDEIFHGEIPTPEIPFMKQKRFSYQREFRLCVDTGVEQKTAITINVGDISHICAKVSAAELPELFKLKLDPASKTPAPSGASRRRSAARRKS